ncbi:MAG: biotin/lipoyl-binding protein, partial [Gemmatimonadota bacterium]
MATPISRPRAVESTDPVAPAAPARRRPPAALVAAVLVLAIAGWGLKQYLGSRNRVSSDNAQIEGHVTPVAARIQAFVSSIRVDDNQPVKQGDTLVVLDQRDLEV